MSRIIVKGLPANIKEESLKKTFSEVGTVTDCSLKYTKDGVFRKFAFVGYNTEEAAQKAVKIFNMSFVNAAKVVVEIAKDFGDATKPRSWSKYSRDSSAYQKMMEKVEQKKEMEQAKAAAKLESKSAKKQRNREAKMADLLGDLKGDAEFEEFVEAHRNRATKATWSNDGGHVTGKEVKGQSSVEKMTFDDDSDEGVGQSEDGSDDSDDENIGEESSGGKDVEMDDAAENVAKKNNMSDLDYLKSKVTKKSKLLESSDSSSGEESDSDDETKEKSAEKPRKKSSPIPGSSKGEQASESSSDDDVEEEEEEEEDKSGEGEIEVNTEECSEKMAVVKHVVKMRGLPPHAREQEVKKFFAPTETVRIKIPRNVRGKTNNGIATVEFKSEKDTDQAMRKNKNFIGPKRILLYKVKKEVKDEVTQKPRPWEQKEKETEDPEEEETIAESGRLYVRNLAFVCKEDDLEAHFGKYGPLTEVNMPIDKLTRKPKGFAFITFMMPEHAVKAFTDLDGTVFQGRMLHILPGKAKKEDTAEDTDNMSYKKKKDLKQKAEASSSHNWNTLFLGANAVADVMAEKYGTAKSDILDPASKQSLGVRMALGETQIVAETRDFLVKNGVALDAFSQPAAARSKTVILVKNLPAGTTADELRNIFGRYGKLDRVVMPPSGVTGIVEYTEPSEARVGFRSLAYTKFQHVPLFLEWAPVNVYTIPTRSAEEKGEENVEGSGTKDSVESSSESEDEVEPESTLYVKNLNFGTTEKSLREAFEKCGPLRNVTIAKKKDMKNPGQLLSMGYGFVEFRRRESAQKAMKTMQHTQLEDHQIELKISNRATTTKAVSTRKKQDTTKKQKSSKILVRNIPFEAKPKEIKELFSTFGELKTVRLPKKLGGTGSHRGFCFVDFLTRQDAKRAFQALCHSTRLYGRRLVLEWANADETVDELRKKTAEHFHDEGPAKRLKKSDLMNELKLSAD